MDVVKLAGADHNIKANIWPGGMAGHACGAHVGPVGHLVLNSLHDSDFSGRAVVVVDWPVRAAADTAIQRSE